MKDLAIKMTPQGVIAGKVLDQDGDPVMAVQMQAMRFAYIQAHESNCSQALLQRTNDLGEYRISNLAPGRYYIIATDRRQQFVGTQERPGRAGEVQEGNITTYYPNGADASNAVPVDVAAGGEMRGIDIRLLQAKVYTVRGKAASTPSLPSPAMVSFRRKDDNTGLPPALNGGSNTQLRPDGTFEFRNILPGTYVLQFTAGEYQRERSGQPDRTCRGDCRRREYRRPGAAPWAWTRDRGNGHAGRRRYHRSAKPATELRPAWPLPGMPSWHFPAAWRSS